MIAGQGRVTLKLKRLTALLLLLAALAPVSALAQTPSCDGELTWSGTVPDCLSGGDTYRIMIITGLWGRL